MGRSSDFLGHAGGENFIIITNEDTSARIYDRLKKRFSEEIQTHYTFLDRQQGFIMTTNSHGQMEKMPLMTLSIGVVNPKKQSFADIREITEIAAEVRRQDAPGFTSRG
jgi:GGDEF domain-containing protein